MVRGNKLYGNNGGMVAPAAPAVTHVHPNLPAANTVAAPLLNATSIAAATAAGVEPYQTVLVQPRTGVVSDLHPSVVTPITKQRFNVPGAGPAGSAAQRAANVSPGTVERWYGTRLNQF